MKDFVKFVLRENQGMVNIETTKELGGVQLVWLDDKTNKRTKCNTSLRFEEIDK